ncbi:MAG: NAD(P)/FAD-dependent oxidoreductase [Myxococcota bacterium]
MPAPELDLVIVGGGPAGLSLALHLDPAIAARTVLLEKARYPREKPCAGAIGGRGIRALRAVGAMPDVPNVPLDGVSIRMRDGLLVSRTPGFGAVVRRIEFDAALAEHARKRVLLREGAAVRAVELADDGVTVRLHGGETLRARAIVGADGVGSVVRKATGFSGGRLRAQVVELDTEPVEGDPPRDLAHFDCADRELPGYAWDFPTVVDGEALVCRGVYLIRSMGAGNVHELLRRYLAKKGLDMERYALKPFAERGFDPGEPVSRPRVLLAGEAAGIDIATGEGIAQAIQYGALAAAYLAGGLARDDLSFADWTSRVRRAAPGPAMIVREGAHRLFFPHREIGERVLLENPAIVDLFAQHMAGNPTTSWGSLVRRLHWRLVPWAVRTLRAEPG